MALSTRTQTPTTHYAIFSSASSSPLLGARRRATPESTKDQFAGWQLLLAPFSQCLCSCLSVRSWVPEPVVPFTALSKIVGEVLRLAVAASEIPHPGGLVIDDQLQLGRLHHRQVGGFRALEDSPGIEPGLTPCIRNAGSIAHQPAVFGKLAIWKGRRDTVACCQIHYLDEPAGGNPQTDCAHCHPIYDLAASAYPSNRLYSAVPAHQSAKAAFGGALAARDQARRLPGGSTAAPANDLTSRFPLIVEALARLHSRSCIIVFEAVACDDSRVAPFNRHPLSQLRRKERRKRKNRRKPYEDEPL